MIKDLDHCSNLSGVQPHYAKSTILCIGSLKNLTFTLPCSLPMKWSDDEMDIHGIHIPTEIKELPYSAYLNRCTVKMEVSICQLKHLFF
jgi:hypothetical protein